MAIVLDSGALIALEHDDRHLWTVLKASAQNSEDVIVPSTALAQTWRGTRRQALLSRALDHCEVASFDEVERAVGELCGRANTSDICDAHVAIVAITRNADVYTSDPDDMRHLVTALGRKRHVIVRC